MFVSDESNGEILSREWNIFYVGYSIAELAQKLFSWAFIDIDEAFYVENAECDYYEEDEDGEYYDRLYVETYPFLSWYIHAGATGTANVTKDGLEGVFGMSHSVMQRVFIDATWICAKETKIAQGIDYFHQWMTEIRLKSGEIIAIEQIKLLEASKQKAQTS